jgi:hypothetical protein
MKKLLFFVLLFLSCTAISAQNPKVVSRLSSGCAECQTLTIDGKTVYVYKNDDISIMFYPSVFKKVLVGFVIIENTSKNRIELKVSDSKLAEPKKGSKTEFYDFSILTPEEAAKKLKGNNFFANFLTGAAAGLATQNQTVRSTGTVRDSSGNSVDYEADSVITQPDRQAQNRASEIINERNNMSRSISQKVLDTALRDNSVFSAQEVFGNIYFKKPKTDFAWFAIRIDDRLYAFPYYAK